jgi:hypothetical protein
MYMPRHRPYTELQVAFAKETNRLNRIGGHGFPYDSQTQREIPHVSPERSRVECGDKKSQGPRAIPAQPPKDNSSAPEKFKGSYYRAGFPRPA